MFNQEKNIYILETEEKPNRYALIVLSAALAGIIGCWVMNELGFFRVDKSIMRTGSAIAFFSILLPFILLIINKNNLRHPAMKYIVITLGFVFAFTTTTLMTFHTTLMILFPVYMAMLYRSKPLGYYALASSLICAICSPILSYLLGTWDVPLFQELILIATNGTAVIENAYAGLSWLNVGKIALYLVIPRMVVVVPCSILMINVIQIGQDHVTNQLELYRISHVDKLTGLYNRNYYNEVLADPSFFGQVGVVFFDVNGLKKLNDKEGHESGDLLLQRSAKSILDICDDNCGAFRVGGDEFLLLIMGATEESLKEKMAEWKNSLNVINEENKEMYSGLHCAIASGSVIGDFAYVEELIASADEIMYQNKRQMKE